MSRKDQRLLNPLNGFPEEIGVWLAALQDARARTLRVVEKIEPHLLNFVPQDDGESISTILYHLAAIEASWLYEDILQLPFPAEIEALFPHDVRDANGKLTRVTASISDHLNRLAKVREQLLHHFLNISVDDFKKPRKLPDYEVSPIYVVHHLMQHEAEHRSQIDAIAMRAKSSLSAEMPEEKS